MLHADARDGNGGRVMYVGGVARSEMVWNGSRVRPVLSRAAGSMLKYCFRDESGEIYCFLVNA